MPLTVPEIIQDLPALLALYEKVKGAIDALPPAANRKTVDYATLVCAVLPDIAALVDSIEAQNATPAPAPHP